MTTNRDVAAYYAALSRLHSEWARILAEAARLGFDPPQPPRLDSPPPSSPPRRGRPRGSSAKATRPRRRRRGPRPSPHANGSEQLRLPSHGEGAETVVPISELSRPRMCLAILRHVGNLTTDGVVTEAKRLGIDWGDVAGGPGNAVHGALWRERQKGTVRKARNGPWELIRPEAAPILDLKRGVALFSGDSLHPNQAVEKRREVVRGLIESGMHSPQEILDQLRSTPGFENTQRSMIRDDLDSLIANGRVEKSGYGVYTAR